MILPVLFGVASTIPLGPAGYSIIENSMNHGIKKGMRSLVELQLVELFYLMIGLTFFQYLSKTSFIASYLEIVATVFLIFFGFILLFESKKNKKKVGSKSTWLWAILNPGILLLYISMVSYFGGDLLSLVFFQLGSLITILALIYISSKRKDFLVSKMGLIKNIIGTIFISIN